VCNLKLSEARAFLTNFQTCSGQNEFCNVSALECFEFHRCEKEIKQVHDTLTSSNYCKLLVGGF